MGIELDFKAEGLEEAKALLDGLLKMGSAVEGVELHGKTREDGKNTNADILDFLAEQGRDFRESSVSDNATIAHAFEYEIEQRALRKNPKDSDKIATEFATAGLTKAMQTYQQQVIERIEAGKTNGTFNAKLSEAYEAWKEKTFGYAYPIGKATGQLLAALNPTGPGAGRLRFIKKR